MLINKKAQTVNTVSTMKVDELVNDTSISPNFMGTSVFISNCESGLCPSAKTFIPRPDRTFLSCLYPCGTPPHTRNLKPRDIRSAFPRRRQVQ